MLEAASDTRNSKQAQEAGQACTLPREDRNQRRTQQAQPGLTTQEHKARTGQTKEES